MRTSLAALAILLPAAAQAASFPISGTFGSEDACAIFAKGGAPAMFESTSDGTLVMPDRVVESGRDCTVTKNLNDGEYLAEMTCKYSTSRDWRPPSDTSLAYAGPLPKWEAKRHKKAEIKNLIWYAEGRAGIVLTRCD